MRTGIVGRKQQRQHIKKSEKAGRTNPYPDQERHTDCQLAVSHQECDCRSVRKNKSAKHRNHEWISAVFQEFVDPELKSAVQRELRAKNLVLAENQKQNSHANSQKCQGLGISQRFGICGWHRRSFGEKNRL